VVRDVDAGYGAVRVLHGVSIEVREGETVALLGTNGNGKSTLIKCIMGMVRPQRGQILYRGSPLNDVEPYRLVEAGLVHVPEARRLFVEMTVEENLDLGALRGEARKRRAQTKEQVFAIFPRLGERRRQISGTLSGGEQQMVAIARGLMARPRLLMIDEPFLGLAPRVVEEIVALMRRIRDEDGISIVFIEQNVELALRLADRGYVLESGRTILTGPSAELLQSAEIKRIFLGDVAL